MAPLQENGAYLQVRYCSRTSATYGATAPSERSTLASTGQAMRSLSRSTNAMSYSGACAGGGNLVSNSRKAWRHVNGSSRVIASMNALRLLNASGQLEKLVVTAAQAFVDRCARSCSDTAKCVDVKALTLRKQLPLHRTQSCLIREISCRVVDPKPAVPTADEKPPGVPASISNIDKNRIVAGLWRSSFGV